MNRVRFVEELLYELINVFIYYKTLTIRRDNNLWQLFSKKLSVCLVRAVALSVYNLSLSIVSKALR